MKKYLHKILNNCAEVSLLALQSQEQPLPFFKQLELKIHLNYCRCCYNFVKQSKLMDKSFRHYFNQLKQAPPFTAPDSFKDKLREQLR